MQNIEKVLITGASKGIGKAIAISLVQNGYEVHGTSRTDINPTENTDASFAQIQFHKMDLIDSQSIQDLAKALGSIDILINNAGVSQVGPIEEVPIARAREYFNANFFGTMEIIQAFLPKMREKGKGLVINVSSMAALFPVPFSTYYAASKAALDCATKSLRNELINFGIKFVIIAPSYFRTTIPQDLVLRENSPYQKQVTTVKKTRNALIDQGSDPEIVAGTILKILNEKDPKIYYPLGKGAKMRAILARILPAKFIEKQIRKNFGLI